MTKRRFDCRFSAELVEQIDYYREKENITRNEFMMNAVAHYLHHLVHDFDIESPMVARMNELTHVVSVLNEEVRTMREDTTLLLGSIVQLARGDMPDSALSDSDKGGL